MGIRFYRPTSAGRRNSSVNDYAELTTDRPEKTLCKRIGKRGGRNHSGKATVRFRGGGTRRIYRLIDFKRNKDGVNAKVASIEYDPNRTCFIALLQYDDGEKRYILAPIGITVGDVLESGQVCEPKTGNCMPLMSIPAGLEVHNVEMTAVQGGKRALGADLAARIVVKERRLGDVRAAWWQDANDLQGMPGNHGQRWYEGRKKATMKRSPPRKLCSSSVPAVADSGTTSPMAVSTTRRFDIGDSGLLAVNDIRLCSSDDEVPDLSAMECDWVPKIRVAASTMMLPGISGGTVWRIVCVPA